MKNINAYTLKKTLIFSFLMISVIGISLISCSKTKEKKEENPQSSDIISINDAQLKNAGILVDNLIEHEIGNKILLNGKIEVPPQEMAAVSTPTGGYIRGFHLLIGSFVKKGQTLAVLDNPELVQLQKDYLMAKSNLGYANKDYSRQKDLNLEQASSDKVTQKAQNEAQNQNIMMHALAEQLRAIGINPTNLSAANIRRSIAVTAPISGYISSINVKVGQYVSPMDKIFEIVNTNHVELNLEIFEKDLTKIKPGLQVMAYTNQNPDQKFPARIYMIGKDFAADRSVSVRCRFENFNPSLLAGTFINAEVETDQAKGWTIPDDGLVTWEGKQYIFQEIKPKTYKMTPVIIGNSENGLTQVAFADPSLFGKKYVTKGAYQLLMGLKNEEE